MAPPAPTTTTTATRSSRASGRSSAGKTRTRSSDRRRKIVAEVEARAKCAREVFGVQQGLIAPGATDALMGAARGLLQAKDYDAVVEERAVDSLCGFPPCRNNAVGTLGGKKWSVDGTAGEVLAQEDLGKFCCRKCMEDSLAFVASLEPDPAYSRAATAVSSARGALAAQQKAATAEPASAGTAKGDAVAESEAATATAPSEAIGASRSGGSRPSEGPKVRRKAVVRFSRETQTYEVHYPDGEASAKAVSTTTTTIGAEDACQAPAADESGLAPAAAEGSTLEPTPAKAERRPKAKAKAQTLQQAILQRLLSAPVVERPDAGPCPPVPAPSANADGESSPTAGATAAEEPLTEADELLPDDRSVKNADNSSVVAPSSAAVAQPRARSAAAAAAASDSESAGEALEDVDSGDDFFDASVPPKAPTGSAFVRVWGTLSCCLHDAAKSALHNGYVRRIDVPSEEDADCQKASVTVDPEEEQRKPHRGRHALLRELLLTRVPPALAHLAPRLEEVVAAVSVHQTLPSVAETTLYDLLAALFLEALLRAEIKRGEIARDRSSEALAKRDVEAAAKRLELSESEVEALRATFGS